MMGFSSWPGGEVLAMDSPAFIISVKRREISDGDHPQVRFCLPAYYRNGGDVYVYRTASWICEQPV